MTSAVGNAAPFGPDYLGDVLHDVWQPLRALSKIYYADVFGAVGDGVTDSTTAIAAVLLAAAQNGGLVQFGPGVYLTNPQITYPGVYVRGHGVNSTTIMLQPGSNADLFNGGATNLTLINPQNQSIGTGNTGGLSYWGFADLTLDGNKANQSGVSYGLRVYGLNYRLVNVDIRNCLSGAALLDWNGGNGQASNQDGMESFIVGCKFTKAGSSGIGLTFGGPHDSQIINCLTSQNGSHGLYIGPHALGPLITQLHSWGSGLGSNSVGILAEGPAQCSNCVAEGSDTVQLVVLTNGFLWYGGYIYGALAHPASGIQLGQQAGLTPYNGSSFQSAGLTTAVTAGIGTFESRFANLTGTNGVVWLANEGLHNQYRFLEIYGGSGNMFSGTPSKTGRITLVSNTPASVINEEFFPGAVGYATSTNTPTNNSTIPTAGLSTVVCNPAAAVTGNILDNASAFDGQEITIVNNSANSITFAVAGTSHVADGATSPIAANSARAFTYVSSASLWFRNA